MRALSSREAAPPAPLQQHPATQEDVSVTPFQAIDEAEDFTVCLRALEAFDGIAELQELKRHRGRSSQAAPAGRFWMSAAFSAWKRNTSLRAPTAWRFRVLVFPPDLAPLFQRHGAGAPSKRG